MRSFLPLCWPTFAVVVALSFPSASWALKQRPEREAKTFPAAVLISARSASGKKSSQCVGVLLGPRAVLTAAHCVAGYDKWTVSAPYAKAGFLESTSTEAKIHPLFQLQSFENDLAVLILDKPLPIGTDYPTLRKDELLPLEAPLVIVGRVVNNVPSQTKLYEATATLVGFPGNVNVYGGNPQRVQPGDSGGPIFLARRENEIAGVVSGFIEFSRFNVPTDLYVPISPLHRAWILSQLPKE